MSDSNMGVALAIARGGLSEFPCVSNAKSPRVKRPYFAGWPQLSSCDEDDVVAWWLKYPNALPAIDLAKSDLVVLDGDRHGGPDGVAALSELLRQHGVNIDSVPGTLTPNSGRHVFFTNGCGLGNRDKGLPGGINVRGHGGYVIAPGAQLSDGRCYQPAPGSPDLIEAYVAGAILELPPGIVALLKADEPPEAASGLIDTSRPPSSREIAYASAALEGLAEEIARIASHTGRNTALNNATHRMATMVARGWIDRDVVERALTEAMHANGYVREDGLKSVRSTLRSAFRAGLRKPHLDLVDRAELPEGVSRTDFRAFMPMHSYIFVPTRELWPAASVNARIPPVPITDAAGQPVLNKSGASRRMAANTWLDQNHPVEQMTWAPGLPMLIQGRLLADGGWIERPHVTCFNLYRPPTIALGDAAKADPWLDHVDTMFGDSADHIILWLAHRAQRPGEKINHALVFGGLQGIGKDSLLEPVKRAVGAWNFHEASPQHMLGRFNGFLKSVILRVNEARDLGDVDRFAFYDHMKAYTAAPPDVLRVDEKHVREYSVFNCVGVILTTNHKTDGIYLPADDRRHYVAWSDRRREEFTADHWNRLWGWYDQGGDSHVAAYLAELDISAFDPKAPPPKTDAFWAIVDAGRAPEDAELADVLDKMGNPDALTLAQIMAKATGEFLEWITDRRNRRSIPHRLERCGYVPVRNDMAGDGLWKLRGARQVIYAKSSLSMRDRLAAAAHLVKHSRQ